MKLLGNLIWFIFGGWAIALEYIAAGLAMCVTIIGIPFGLQCFKLALNSVFPFGSTIENSEGAGALSLLMNVIWICIGGVWIALTHLIFGVLFCCTIVGIPFGMQHFKLTRLALFPFGKSF